MGDRGNRTGRIFFPNNHHSPMNEPKSSETKPANRDWQPLVAEFTKPSAWRASWQLLNTVGVYVGLWVAMYFAKDVSWWLTMGLAVLAGAFLIRIFIFQHDCGHGSFFKSRRANDFWGWITGALTFTPYGRWRREHAIHHASSGDLERRGIGDIWTMTVQEYLESTKLERFAYRFSRHWIVLFVIAPLWLFLYRERIFQKNPKPGENTAIMILNFVLLGMAIGLSMVFGFLTYLIVQLTALIVAGGIGIWLFYVQHQFEDAYWESGEEWDYFDAAIKGSSFYKLPKVLQWFTGNIGFHHIHHLSPKVPNYNLERCHRAHAMFNEVKPIRLFESFKTLSLGLWCEKTSKLITFGALKQQLREQRAGA